MALSKCYSNCQGQCDAAQIGTDWRGFGDVSSHCPTAKISEAYQVCRNVHFLH